MFSVVLGGLITAAVVVAASPLLGQGADAANAAAVAERLEPLLGRAAPVFFGLGLFAAGLTSAITAPLAAAYAAGGALGWPPDLRSGRFRLLWGFVLATGVFCAVALGGSPYYVILLAQAGNGLVLPLTLILLLMVANKTRIMGTHRNSRLTNVLGVTRRAGDLVAGAAATSPGAGACRIGMGEERSVAAARYASSDIQARWFAPRERARWGGGMDPWWTACLPSPHSRPSVVRTSMHLYWASLSSPVPTRQPVDLVCREGSRCRDASGRPTGAPA